LPFQLPLRRNRRSVANRIESYFCRSSAYSWTANQRSGHCSNAVNGVNGKIQRKDVSTNSVLTRNGNGSYGNGTTATVQRNGSTATEWWKPGITD